MITKKQFCEIVGWFAVIMAYLLFGSFIDQIRLNLAGKPCSIFLPLGLIINCGAWTGFALLKEKVDKQMFAANATGVIIGIITLITV